MFTTSVAHIGPATRSIVAIEYQQTLRYDSGLFSLRFPLAITPRYIPGVRGRRQPERHRLVAATPIECPTLRASRHRSCIPMRAR